MTDDRQAAFDLHGHSVLITGASSGIGRSLALDLAAAGARVALAARRLDRLEDLAGCIRNAGGEAVAIRMDVSDADSVSAAFDEAETAFGTLSGVVANSGINKTGSANDISPEAFDEVFSVNVRGAFLTAREGARRMITHAVAGRIVLIASIGGLKPLPGAAVYSATKSAVVMFGRALAQEWVTAGINVNVVCPGYISTELNAHLFEGEQGQQRLERFPRRRLMTSRALSPMVGYLLSGASDMCTGGVFTIDDGQTLADADLKR